MSSFTRFIWCATRTFSSTPPQTTQLCWRSVCSCGSHWSNNHERGSSNTVRSKRFFHRPYVCARIQGADVAALKNDPVINTTWWVCVRFASYFSGQWRRLHIIANINVHWKTFANWQRFAKGHCSSTVWVRQEKRAAFRQNWAKQVWAKIALPEFKETHKSGFRDHDVQ